MIITLKTVLKRTILITLCAILIASTWYLKIPSFIFSHLAKSVFATEEKGILYDTLSINTMADMKHLFPYEISVLEEEIPLPQKTVIVKNNPPKKEEPKVDPITPSTVDFSKDKSSLAMVSNNITIVNHAKKTLNINEILNMPLIFTKSQNEYKVLIIHTHTSECYMPDDRCDDQSKNVVRVGDEFKNVLEQNKIKTLHSTKVHDKPYKQSYKNQLATISQTLKQYPSIEVVIDVHRDALYNAKKEKIKPATTINNKKVSQVMLVCGTNAMGLPHDNWKNCFSFALKIQNDMNKNYPNLARPVDLRQERFNTHMTKGSIIFEIGANGNTLEEAVGGANLAAQSVANVLNGK